MALSRGSLLGGCAAATLIGASAADAASPGPRFSPADLRALERLAIAKHVPTASVATVSGTSFARWTILGDRASGVAPRDVFEAASLSKPVLAIGVLALVAAGDCASTTRSPRSSTSRAKRPIDACSASRRATR